MGTPSIGNLDSDDELGAFGAYTNSGGLLLILMVRMLMDFHLS